MKNNLKKWQLLAIVITILILTLSALPTFYGKVETVAIQSVSQSSAMPSVSHIKTFLQNNQIDVDSIRLSKETMRVFPTSLGMSPGDIRMLIANELDRKFNGQFVVSIDEQEASPAWLQSMGFNSIKLGLDLNGGVLFVLHVDVGIALNEKLKGVFAELKQHIRDARIRGISAVLKSDQTIRLTFSDAKSLTKLNTFIKDQLPQLEVKNKTNGTLFLNWKETEVERFHQELMQQSVAIMRTRIESLGITEAAVQRQGRDHIRIELPGVKDPKEAGKIIGTTATLDVYPIATQPSNQKIIDDQNGRAVAVHGQPVFAGFNIQSASAGIDDNGFPLVNLVLDKQGGEKMSRFSKDNIGQPMVTVFSEYQKNQNGDLVKRSEVINVATVITQLRNRFSITNLSSAKAAQELAILIRAGSLNAPVSIVEQRTIDASLGEENVASGFAALSLGVGLTMLFMAMWYRKLGLIANTSLIINLICLLGLMAWLPGIVLTLPGIAGLVLTVGMAVDTNVLIFERIKLEASKNPSPILAIEHGYNRAFATILDANITTMICALILLGIGNGPVKGFAMTLSLGLLTSMFSGVYIARFITRLFPARTLLNNRELAQ